LSAFLNCDEVSPDKPDEKMLLRIDMKTVLPANFANFVIRYFTPVAIAALAALFAAPTPSTAQMASPAELRTSRALEAVRANPLELEAFLVEMPKGTDLHNHLTGAIYAESLIRDAAEDQLCVNPSALAFTKPDQKSNDTTKGPACENGNVPATQALKDQHLYDALIDSFSMRSFVPTTGTSGHDHFFDSFNRFHGTSERHKGEWLYEVATRAAAQNIQYMELMETPPFNRSAAAAHEVGWYPDLAKMREVLLAKLGDGLNQDRADDLAFFTDAEATRDKLAHCGQPDAQPACHVTQKFIYQVLRGFSKEQVFAQTLLGFETISADPRRIVGINFVMPEDSRVSMADFEEQMKMLDYLHSVYPKVHITMHAGELAPGLVPYEGLCCHIHWAVELGHAERIGHGVDIMHELDSYKLMDIMANNHVMVEIALSSNDLILGISGKDHPFPIFRKHNVPVSLSTDDEGVSRIDLTHEYVRAVETYNLRYADLKQMIRTGMEHSFQQGESLWAARDVFKAVVASCAKDQLCAEKPSPSCATFLKSSEKATQQWDLEARFRQFESTHQ
jgi:adenosine deaminase